MTDRPTPSGRVAIPSGSVVHVLGPHPYDRYVGRRSNRHGLKGNPMLANPFKVGEHGTLVEVLTMYEDYIRSYIAESPDGLLVETLRCLDGKTLACWCAPRMGRLRPARPETCHGQVLLRLARELEESREPEGKETA